MIASKFIAGSQPRAAAFMIGVLAGSLIGGILAGLLAPRQSNSVQPAVREQARDTTAGAL